MEEEELELREARRAKETYLTVALQCAKLPAVHLHPSNSLIPERGILVPEGNLEFT